MDDRPYILHLMNSVYGRNDQYGVRSRWIAQSAYADHPIEVYARAGKGQTDGGASTVHRVSLPLNYQFLRYSMAVLRQSTPKKRSIGRGFDEALRSAIRRGGVAADTVLIHAWDWTPLSLRLLKDRFPDARVVRDVVVNRYYEFFSGTPIIDQNGITDAFFSPSTFTTARLVEWGIPREKVIEIPFGVDTETFRPRNTKRNGPIRFAFTGAVSKRKGVDTLLRAWKRLALPDAELHLYGRLRDVKRDLKGAQQVICHGHVPLAEELPKNDVYVFPSTLEGSAKSVYEALACGLPVITTPESGSIVRHGTDGLLVPSGDEEELLAAMRTLYESPELRRGYGEAARTRAEEHTWDRYAERVWGAYSALMSGR